MALIDKGIEKVMAFDLPGGIWTDGDYFAQPRLVLVRWRSTNSNMPHQVYVNGQFAGVTADNCQRQMVIQIPSSFISAVRIEVFAVQPEHAHIDFGSELQFCAGLGGRARLTILRSQKLPPGASCRFYCDNGVGSIDYENPVDEFPLSVWASPMDKCGFAMSRFGLSDFGYDASAAVGFGKGSFGNGVFGIDADVLEWLSPSLAQGSCKFAVTITDANGITGSPGETEPVTVVPPAKADEKLSISSFDKQTNQLMLKLN